MNSKTNDLSIQKVTVIVPVHNVEPYIRKCISSIMSQTHKNIEIIAVNDGSEDNSGMIIDLLKMEDQRIITIHQKNQGVSVARNKGMAAATGEYIVFVDGDDYLDPDFVRYMLFLVKKTGAEFCLSKNCYTKASETQVMSDRIEILTPENAAALLLSPAVIVGCWNKIYKRSLLENHAIKFSEDLFYGEGLYFITTVAQTACTVGVGNKKNYYYRKNNSTSATTAFNIKKIYNGERSLDMIKNKLNMNDSSISEMFTIHLCLYSMSAAVSLIKSKAVHMYPDDYIQWKKNVRATVITALKSKKISGYTKLKLICFIISPLLITELAVLKRAHVSKNSV